MGLPVIETLRICTLEWVSISLHGEPSNFFKLTQSTEPCIAANFYCIYNRRKPGELLYNIAHEGTYLIYANQVMRFTPAHAIPSAPGLLRFVNGRPLLLT